MAEHSSSADVLIVGGGIIGCTIAWRLAQAGSKVIVLDRSEPGLEASSAAAGMVAPASERVGPPDFRDLCLASRSRYPQFAVEVEEASGHTIGYRRDGTLLVAFDKEQERELTALQHQQATAVHAIEPLSGAEVERRAPGLAPKVRRGLFLRDDHWLDNERLMRALVLAAGRAGVRFQAGCEVRDFRTEHARITGIVTKDGATFTAAIYVLAAGSWSGELVRGLGLDLPVTPCRGQMMEFEVTRELPCVVRAGMHYLVPRPDRRVLAGTTVEYAGFEKVVTGEGLSSVLQGALHLAPWLAESRFLRAWAGLRPDTADHLPILGYSELENLIFATGHFRNGILLAPVTAEIVSDLIIEKASSRPLELYRPTRFHAAKG